MPVRYEPKNEEIYECGNPDCIYYSAGENELCEACRFRVAHGIKMKSEKRTKV